MRSCYNHRAELSPVHMAVISMEYCPFLLIIIQMEAGGLL